ncbi:hypothetical protein LQG66_14910 [Bradyrhizobium ontarionense]|uniref:Uncharacterized protein n=1 Tax=Bradyrhizobium ontarionense TaxID=2898149 RepID=A0ABY3RJM5_9BRAD|nr:hypothetical protein [Bradyrhizobium sp. A19]UFZ07513.1 hypothetical protein LQG66_14910 [Bradyrhizobium sp. A19]
MRYVSWFGGWLGHLLPQRRADAGTVARDIDVQHPAAELSHEDLFYIAMLGPHV